MPVPGLPLAASQNLERRDIHEDRVGKQDVEISAVIANALVVGSALSEEQLDAAYRHYRTLAELLAISGPKFVDARAAAAELGNTAMTRLRTHRKETAAAKARAKERDDGLDAIT